jgi:glycosyltransferase involved in cell wall biosynthesis
MSGQTPEVILLAEAAGGVMRHVIDLYRGLRAKDWRVQLVLSPLRLDARYRDELDRLEQRDIIYIPMDREPNARDLKACSAVAGVLDDARGEAILHAHSTKAGAIGALLHSHTKASVLTPHAYRGMDPTCPQFSRRLVRAAERIYSGRYDRVIAVSPAEMEYAKSIGVKEEVLRYIPHGLDTSRIAFPQIYRRRAHLGRRLCLGFVGRLVSQKNPMLFIEVLAELVARGCDAHAIIVGDGPLRSEMARRAEGRGIAGRLDWRGEVPAVPAMEEMDIMVHTSVYEALPYTLIEACGALLPIVALDNGGSRALLGASMPENLASSAAPVEFATIIAALVRNNSRRVEQLGLLGAIALEHRTDCMVMKTEAEYRSLLSSDCRRRRTAKWLPWKPAAVPEQRTA